MHNRIEALAAELEALRQEVVELAEVEEPTDEQVARMDELLPAIEAKQAAHSAEVERAERVAKVREMRVSGVARPERATPDVVVRDSSPFDNIEQVARGYATDRDMVARATDAIERTEYVGLTDASKERATRLAESNPRIARHILLTGSPAYREAFETVLRYGPEVGMGMLDGEQRDAMRAALSNTAANGGYSNPWLLDPTVILTNDGIAGSIRSISRVETGTTDKWNGISSAGVTAEWLAEGTEAADKTPTVGQPSVTAYKGAAYVFASYEQEADGQVVAQLPRLIADAKFRLEEAAFATGSGSGEPTGVVTAVAAVTASRVSPTTGGTFTSASIADVYKVIEAVPPRHRSMSSWLANYTTLNTIRKMDTYGGSSFWTNLGGGTPAELLGQPVYENSTMTATVTTGSNLILAGDFSQYLIYDRVGTEMRYLPVVVGSNQRPTGQAGWFAFWRTGAGCLNTNAFALLQL